ncbi:hypothetical protein BJ165DRAFT_1409506 [Panaeolus papilionaceus]|nr:hypothetical protein BJ165DRAFT_1409506 [Panaeolus papilionaceus]
MLIRVYSLIALLSALAVFVQATQLDPRAPTSKKAKKKAEIAKAGEPASDALPVPPKAKKDKKTTTNDAPAEAVAGPSGSQDIADSPAAQHPTCTEKTGCKPDEICERGDCIPKKYENRIIRFTYSRSKNKAVLQNMCRVPSYGLIARITGIMLHSGRKKNTDILTDRGPPIRNRAGCVPNYCQPKGYKLLGKYASCDEYPFASTVEGGGARGQKSSLSCIPKKQNSAQGGTLSKLGKWDREIKQDFKFALSIDCDKVPTTGGIYQPDNAVTLGTSPALDASAAQAPLSGPTPPIKCGQNPAVECGKDKFCEKGECISNDLKDRIISFTYDATKKTNLEVRRKTKLHGTLSDIHPIQLLQNMCRGIKNFNNGVARNVDILTYRSKFQGKPDDDKDKPSAAGPSSGKDSKAKDSTARVELDPSRVRNDAGCVKDYCRKNSKAPGYLSCDEYPPASSVEGGGTRNKKSIACIPAKENQHQGGVMGPKLKMFRKDKENKEFVISIDCDKVPLMGGIYQVSNRKSLIPPYEPPKGERQSARIAAAQNAKRDETATSLMERVFNDDYMVVYGDTGLGHVLGNLTGDVHDSGSVSDDPLDYYSHLKETQFLLDL